MNFFVISDLGEENNSDQIVITENMGKLAEEYRPSFIVLNGDCHHQNPPMTLFEKLWMRDFDFIYSDFNEKHNLRWIPVLGNHEYKGDISKVMSFYENHPRFDKQILNHRYYGKILSEVSTLLLFLDTTPLIEYYREHHDDFPDVWKQSKDKQIKWLDNILSRFEGRFDNIICFGHHPIYAYDKMHTNSNDVEKVLLPIFNEYQVTTYISSHVHNFQWIEKPDIFTKFITNSSCSYTNEVKNIDGSKFSSSGTGFTIVSIDENTKEILIRFVDKTGQIILCKSVNKDETIE
jgi:acid phosphatase